MPNDVDRMTNAVAAARSALGFTADEETLATIDRLYKAGLGAWRLDPEVDDVVGFMRTQAGPNDAWLVVYIGDHEAAPDFECGMEFVEETQRVYRNYANGEWSSWPVEEKNERWYIKPGFAGYNSRANNGWGYSTAANAMAACMRYQTR